MMERSNKQKILPRRYWKRFLGIETFKLEWYAKRYLYDLFGITLPKLIDQRRYWQKRGTVYFDEITASGYLDREIFFQDMLIDFLTGIAFSSFFEAGCGFGWNIGRVKRDFPQTFVSGVDFSFTQLSNANRAIENGAIPLINGDACRMPLKDNAFEVGFTLGVFMNIHPRKIILALKEMLRVCERYIIHIEYDDSHTTDALKQRRAIKTNIISHDYRNLYESLGATVLKFSSHIDFGQAFRDHEKKITSVLDRWEGFEGPEKYVFIVIQVPESLH